MSAISISGNVATDVELKFLQSGQALAEFMVISSKSRKDEKGDWEDYDKVAWNIKCWRTLAENVSECITKGLPVVISGDISQENWENDKGEKRSKMVLTAYHVGIDLARTMAKKTGESQTRRAPAKEEDTDPWAIASTTKTEEEPPPF
jgi:single-strand DNA-binding protein